MGRVLSNDLPPTSSDAAHDAFMSSGKMSASMVYHAPRQKEATPAPTRQRNGTSRAGKVGMDGCVDSRAKIDAVLKQWLNVG